MSNDLSPEERLAQYIYDREASKCKSLDEALAHKENWRRAIPEARAMLEAAGVLVETRDFAGFKVVEDASLATGTFELRQSVPPTAVPVTEQHAPLYRDCLIYDGKVWGIGQYMGHKTYSHDRYPILGQCKATHWMPLPADPVSIEPSGDQRGVSQGPLSLARTTAGAPGAESTAAPRDASRETGDRQP